MTASSPANVTVVGLGCIGGSIARGLVARGVHVRGWSTSAEDVAMARDLDVEVPATSLGDAVSSAELLVLAVPVQAIARVASEAMRAAMPDAVIVHCGGVQSRDALHLDESAHARIVGAHPIAGSHDSGFGAARADLFRDRVVSVESRASQPVRTMITWLWESLGASRLEYRTAEEHDEMMVWVSHLPQLASTALASTFAAAHIDPASVGPGARDATRLAASAFEQWSELVRAQPAALGAALEKLEHGVASIRAALASDDERALRALWDSARAWRRAAEPAP